MKTITSLLFFVMFSTLYPSLGIYAAGDGTCKKCQVLRKYHEDNPCPYEYYEDYLKALEEKKEIPKVVKPEELLNQQEEQETTNTTYQK